jgi:flagellar export protein FliJ
VDAFQYRLQALLDRKREQKEAAERALAQARHDLRDCEQRLAGTLDRQARMEAQRAEQRRTLLSSATTGQELQQRVGDLDRAGRRIEEVKDEAMALRLELEEHKEKVESAAAGLAEATRELEVLKKHRERSERRFRAEVARRENAEHDEIASAMFEARRRP